LLTKDKRLIEFARKFAHKSVGKNSHVSLLVIRNKVISYGVNNYLKTHPKGPIDRLQFIHSELDCIRKFNFRENNINKAVLYNFRFSRLNLNNLLMSQPCVGCLKLAQTFNIRCIFYSTPEGMVEL
jgi:hypothetical protein